MQAFVSSCGEVVPVSTGISCDVAFASFLSAFEGKSSLEPPPANQINYEGSYHTYLTTMEFFGPINNLVLFWSKTKPLQKALVSAGANIASSDSVYASKVVDQLYDGGISAWCSNTTGNISINEMCMMYDVGKMNTPAYVFWAEFSERLAEYAEGNAFFLTMNGTYQDTSFFGMFELPILLLPQSSTSKLVVINVVPADSSNVCGTGRLMSLESKATEVIEYKCFDIYGDAENPSDELVNCADQIINSVQEGELDVHNKEHGF